MSEIEGDNELMKEFYLEKERIKQNEKWESVWAH